MLKRANESTAQALGFKRKKTFVAPAAGARPGAAVAAGAAAGRGPGGAGPGATRPAGAGGPRPGAAAGSARKEPTHLRLSDLVTAAASNPHMANSVRVYGWQVWGLRGYSRGSG